MDEFYQIAQQLEREGTPFVIATVTHTEGSTSAKTGAKALLNAEGATLWGWIGGGCVESQVRDAALETLAKGIPQRLQIDLTDEVLSVPCGGHMELFLEPMLAVPHLQLIGHGRVVESLVKFARYLGFRITVFDSQATPETYPQADHLVTHDPSLQDLSGGPRSFIVVATHHKRDDMALERALSLHPTYVSLVASKYRTQIVFNQLKMRGITEAQLGRIHAPAGLNLGAATPEEIALSIMGEIVQTHRKGSKEPSWNS